MHKIQKKKEEFFFFFCGFFSKLDLGRWNWERGGGGGLAGLKTIAVRIAGGGGGGGSRTRKKIRRSAKKKVKKVGDKLMELWRKMVFPVRRVWLSVSARLKARNHGAGHMKLEDDVQTCEYQDVQVMWEMLKRSETELMANNPKRKVHRPFWRVLVWSNHKVPASLAADHA